MDNRPMTVQSLIEWLQQIPEPYKTHVGVIYSACSDLTLLREGDLSYHSPEEAPTNCFRKETRYVLRNGLIMEYDEKTWPPEEQPHFIGVVEFPGN